MQTAPKQKAFPSSAQMNCAYRWLTSFNMADRLGKCKPPPSCAFLVDHLSENLRCEFEEHGDLRWRDWNFCYFLLDQKIASPVEREAD